MLPPRATMSSGWVRAPVIAAPVPFGWKLCFSTSPKAICLTVSPLGGALGLALALGELALEHPAVPSRPAAATVAPSHVAVRRLKMFTKSLVCHLSDARCAGAKLIVERFMAGRRPSSKGPVNARPSSRAGLVLRGG